jgi:ATP-dependent DNA ligase
MPAVGPVFWPYGVISKRAGRPYAPGDRGIWVKSKCLIREEFVVVGWTDTEGSRENVGALRLGYYTEDGRLRYAGTHRHDGEGTKAPVGSAGAAASGADATCRTATATTASVHRSSSPEYIGCGPKWS